METEQNELLLDAVIRFASVSFAALSLLITVYLWSNNESIIRGCYFINIGSLFTAINLMRSYKQRHGIINYKLNNLVIMTSLINILAISFILIAKIDTNKISVFAVILLITTALGFFKELRIAIIDFRLYSKINKEKLSPKEKKEEDSSYNEAVE